MSGAIRKCEADLSALLFFCKAASIRPGNSFSYRAYDKRKGVYPMDKTLYLPFYMTYPVKYPLQQENRAARDIEYLREMYPAEAKKLLTRISDILDDIDYEESMIYDEYPDRWQLYRLAESIVRILKNDAVEAGEEFSEEHWEWVSDMVQVLLFDEIFNRRHGNRSGQKRSQIYIDRQNWMSPYEVTNGSGNPILRQTPVLESSQNTAPEQESTKK